MTDPMIAREIAADEAVRRGSFADHAAEFPEAGLGPEECPCDCHAQQPLSIRAVSACIWCDKACQAEYAYWTEIAGGVGCAECAGSPAVRAAVRNAVLRSRES